MTKPLPILAFLALCVACGSKFEPGGGAGGTGGDGGDSAAGGTDRGGSAGAPGGGAAAGGAAAGGADTAGAPGGGAGGASAGAGGVAGAGGAADCNTLIGEYTALVQKARVCDPAMMGECSASSTLQPIGCGCPTPVNAKSESTTAAKAKYAQIEKNKCNNGPICGIACIPYTGATCTQQTQGSGKAYVCTGSQGGIAN